MKRQFCDRCGADVTDKQSASVSVVADADALGGGEVTTTADLCTRCGVALVKWLAAPTPTPRRSRRARH